MLSPNTIEQRLLALETENRRTKTIAILLLLSLGAVLLMGQAAFTNKINEAQAFVLKDAKGNVRANLFVDDEGQPRLYMFSKKAGDLVSLGFEEEKPLLRLMRAPIGKGE